MRFIAFRFQNVLEGMPPEPTSKILPRLWQRSGYTALTYLLTYLFAPPPCLLSYLDIYFIYTYLFI